MGGPLADIESAEVEGLVKDNMKISNRLLSSFNPKSIAYGVATKFRDDASGMSQHIAIIEVPINFVT